MIKGRLPDQQTLQQLFSYDPDSGELRWRERSDIVDEVDCRQWNIKFAGEIAGCLSKRGYCIVMLKGKTFTAHRLIWKLVYGRDPEVLDHKNCNPDDNRLCNLREVTWHQNARNRKPIKNKKSGLPKGVVFNRDRESVRYQVSVGKNNYIGIYNTISEARRSYRIHARRLFGEFARHA